MRVEHLSLTNFRNYAHAELPLGEGPQLLVGRNGQGKTNLAEAIAYFNALSSHRVTNDAPLIRAGEASAVVRMRVAVRQREATLELEFQRGKPKRAQVSGHPVKPRELLHWFTCVVFAPEDLAIARGEPSVRRSFLDDAIVTRSPAMIGVFRDYERVLKQRNSLLRSVHQGASREDVSDVLALWDEQLIGFGSRIMAERRSLLRDLMPHLRRAYTGLVEADHHPALALTETASGGSEAVVWQPGGAASRGTSTDAEALDRDGHGFENVSRETSGQTTHALERDSLTTAFTGSLDQTRDAEYERGVTLVGPHRDDLTLELNGLPVKGFASHGETWSFVLALRLAFAELLRAESQIGDPVIILDDVFAELDQRRRQQLMAAVGEFEQIVVTAAVPEDIPRSVAWNVAHISAGEIVSRETWPVDHPEVAETSAFETPRAIPDSGEVDP